MSHNYLLDLHQYVERRITALTDGSDMSPTTPEEQHRADGRLEALRGFKLLLCRDFYPKLPKRIYRQLGATACETATPGEPENCMDTNRNC